MPSRPSLLLAVCLLSACAGEPEPAPAFTVRGLYLGPAYDSAAVVVSHEAIPGFMEAMQMPFRIADRSALRGLREGDKIRFHLSDEGTGYRVTAIETLPPDTPLDLVDNADDTPLPADSAKQAP